MSKSDRQREAEKAGPPRRAEDSGAGQLGMAGGDVMGRCGNCKHWGSEAYEYYDDEADDGAGYSVQRKCARVKSLHKLVRLNEKLPEAEPFVLDGGGYTGSLWTPPTFGCALFEANGGER
jgi:hypothetical protein